MRLYKFAVILIMFICSNAFGSEGLIIDLFEYARNSTAQNAWKPQAGSPSVELTLHRTGRGEQALLLPCNFSRGNEQCYWDREVKLDLTKFGRFSLWVCVENPQALQNGTLYFQSGDGWFAGKLPIERSGWQKISLWKSDFRVGGSLPRWNDIRKIRLSFRNAGNTDALVAVDNLEAIADDIMIVFGDLTTRKKSFEAKSVDRFCTYVTKLLEDLGLEFGVVNDTDVESGAISGCKLAILPYNPDISKREYEAIQRFVKSGGKIMLFYSLPKQLAELLGIEYSGWIQEEYSGQFSSIQMEVGTIEGLPKSILQSSWNITIPKPCTSQTKVIGKWVDSEGKKEQIPAITINPNGVFIGHVLLPNDTFNKKQMLLSLFGKLVPDMRQYLSRKALENVGKIAGFEGFHAVSLFVENNIVMIPEVRRQKTLKHLEESKRLIAQTKHASESNEYGKTLDTARRAMEELQEAFFHSFPSRKEEFRALWCHSAFGIPGWNWDESIRWLKENGFNAIIPNMFWAGLAYYPSDVLSVAEELGEKGDQIAQCLKACRKYGIQIHIWRVNWNLSKAPEELVKRMREMGRLQKDRWGNDLKWLCPSHPKNFKLELESMLEVVRKYDVDGIHFDYIRYPHENACYCPKCKESFEKDRGMKVKDWPKGVISGVYAEDFTRWRCNQITRFVKAVSEQARKINPEIKISAAVFKNYPRCRQTVGQDWVMWVESGYLDFVCPMDYTEDNDQFRDLVSDQMDMINGRIPLYPGIGASAPGLSPEKVAMQVQTVRNLGASGFIIFSYDLSVARSVLPALSKGMTSK